VSKPLPKKLRAKWDELIETEGAAMGLSDCRVFLENKLVNDIFYEGLYKGVPCVVKCSSKAPESILNEFDLSKRVFVVNPTITPAPLACHVTNDGRMAFIITAKAKGPSLTELMEYGISDDDFVSYATDFLRIAETFRKVGIIHRDLFSDNLLLDDDGHVKAIDFQFAVDRNNYRECRWMRMNWKYRYVIFARNAEQLPASWNDITSLRQIIKHRLPSSLGIEEIDAELAEMESSSLFRIEIPVLILPRAIAYIISLYLQCLFRDSKRNFVLKKRMHNTFELIKTIFVSKL
jgi:serine/threonine protein kinase